MRWSTDDKRVYAAPLGNLSANCNHSSEVLSVDISKPNAQTHDWLSFDITMPSAEPGILACLKFAAIHSKHRP